MATKPVVSVSTELLLKAFWQMRRRLPDWPGDFEEAMQHPVRKRLVRAMAFGLALGQSAEPPLAIAAWLPHLSSPTRRAPSPASMPRHTGIDGKRAASGDRDESPQLF